MRGFGSSGSRFKPCLSKTSSEQLGPGHYNVPSDVIGSFAKVGGTGCFASKSLRFKRVYGRSSPGPAAYNTQITSTSPTVRLVKPSKTSHTMAPTIGPGHYDPKLPISNALAWFRTTSKRFKQAPESSDLPSPGDYVLPSTLSSSRVPRIANPVIIREPVIGLGGSLLPLPLKYAQDINLIENCQTPGPTTYDPIFPGNKDFSAKVSAGFAVPESAARH